MEQDLNSKIGNRRGKGEMKTNLISTLADSPLSLDDLKSTMKREYGISRKDITYHLNNNQYGLTQAKNGKVVIIKNGNLTLNLEDPQALIKIMEIMINDPQRGKDVSRTLNYTFLRCFLSPIGDFPLIPYSVVNLIEHFKPKEVDGNLGKAEFDDLINYFLHVAELQRENLTTRFMLSYIFKAVRIMKVIRDGNASKIPAFNIILYFWPNSDLENHFSEKWEEYIKRFGQFGQDVEFTGSEDDWKKIIAQFASDIVVPIIKGNNVNLNLDVGELSQSFRSFYNNYYFIGGYSIDRSGNTEEFTTKFIDPTELFDKLGITEFIKGGKLSEAWKAQR